MKRLFLHSSSDGNEINRRCWIVGISDEEDSNNEPADDNDDDDDASGEMSVVIAAID